MCLFLVALFSSISWWYASINHRLIDSELENKVINYIAIESLFTDYSPLYITSWQQLKIKI